MSEFVKAKEIITSLTSDASGDATAVVDLSGRVYMQKCYAATSGAHVTVQELIQEPGEVTLTGDTIFERVVNGNVTHRPFVNPTTITGATISGQFMHPIANQVIITVASGGNTKPTRMYHYVMGA